MPPADAIVNPNLSQCGFPSKSLAGVGVAFYLMLAVRAKFRELGIFTAETQPNFTDLLDLVALGTVADVVPLDQNNRILAYQGLMRIRARRCRPRYCCIMQKWLTVMLNSLLQMISVFVSDLV